MRKKILPSVLLVLFALPIVSKGQPKLIASFAQQRVNGILTDYDSTLFSYDDSGRLFTKLYKYYDNTTGKWVNLYKYDYSYTPQGTIKQLDFLTNSGGSWKNFYQYLYTYNANNLLQNILELRWTNNQYKNYTREDYIYRNDGKLDSIKKHTIDSTNKLSNFTQIAYTYTVNGLIETETHEWWNQNTNSWVPSKYIYTYNTTLQNTKIEHQVYSNMTWVTNNYYLNMYDNHNLLTKTFTIQGGSNDTTRVDYYFYEGGLNTNIPIPKKDALQVAVFPNPANGEVQFGPFFHTGSQIQLFDIQGRLLKIIIHDSPGIAIINCEDLEKGVYLYRASSGGLSTSGKLVLQ